MFNGSTILLSSFCSRALSNPAAAILNQIYLNILPLLLQTGPPVLVSQSLIGKKKKKKRLESSPELSLVVTDSFKDNLFFSPLLKICTIAEEHIVPWENFFPTPKLELWDALDCGNCSLICHIPQQVLLQIWLIFGRNSLLQLPWKGLQSHKT